MKTLIVGSSGLDLAQLEEYIAWADYSIACDGGYDHFVRLGKVPDSVIGDEDSVISEVEMQERYPTEKDFSDLEAAIHIAVKSSDDIVILGATGGRQDHFLSAVMQLFLHPQRIRIIDPSNEIWVERQAFRFEAPDYRYFSLFPLDPLVVSIQGAKYELDQVELNPYTSLALSNEPRGEVQVDFDAGRVIVVLSRDAD